MVLIDKEYNCTGCGCCESLCPVSAIKMKENKKGFLYPVINEKYCINCGICKKNCPNLGRINKENNELKIYAMKNSNEDIRESSSSGGFFYNYAKLILELSGTIYGASFNSFNEVEHIRITELDNLKKLQGSKYVQSKINNSYIDVQKDLENDKFVLFSGTPCQVEGLKTFLSKKKTSTEKLYTCDIICHGVPSPKIFNDYLTELEKQYNSKIKNINFRHKENNLTQNIKITFENGDTYLSNYYKNDKFYKLFLDNVILRDSCYECKYSSFNRVGDISLGDFWGIENSIQNFDDNKGVSLVLVNTQKGKDIFNKLKNDFDFVETSKENCIQDNLVHPQSKSSNYEEFWNNYLNN